MRKKRSAPKIVKNLLLMREELARYNSNYVAKTMVEKIDCCLYGEYTLIRNGEKVNEIVVKKT